jgi:hypothetical protein
LAVGRWAGFAAIVLCLTTGNLYGHLFFTPYDIPFMAAMTWATLAIIVMSRTPTWPATIAAGLLTGLAVATRFGGVLTQVYLVGAMGLCALEIGLRPDGRAKTLLAIGAKTVVALMLGWLFAIALWPWLQSTDPIGRFKTVYDYFVSSYVHFDFPYWGETVSSKALPWHYIPGQLLARLPEAFIALLIVALVFGLLAGARFLIDGVTGIRRNGLAGAVAPALELARARGLLVVAVAALAPAIFVVVRGSVIFDGLRHMLFILPPLAVLAAWGLLRLMPLIRRVPLVFAAAGMMHVAATVAVLVILHPLEYVAMNGFAGGTAGAYGRFDLDYWAAAATQAVRNLEARLADSGTVSQSSRPPRVLVCIGFRENMVAPMFARRWHAETEPRKADFIVETERWRCGSKVGGTTIDRIERFGRTFARTIATTPRAGRPAVSSADELPVTDDDL